MSLLIYMLIAGMALVTYIPRALPAVVIDRMTFGPRLEKFLKLIPYTALAALIFPGIMAVDETQLSVGIIGGLTALVVTLLMRRANVGVVVIAAVAAVMAVYALL